ncbi:MAG TPA: ribose 5-phosphate isomerase B [Chitinophagales bacterium]|nr:ribose 5-phosphate isomerase B [Chitinophagales bacterium]
MNIAIGSDHAGFDLKTILVNYLQNNSTYICQDFGTYSPESVDYPDFAHLVADAVATGQCDKGILLCGSANGVAITANKHATIRAALCWQEEIATLARQHNDANILCIPARFVTTETAFKMVDIFLNTPFEGGRHAQRVAKISCYTK